MILSTQILSLIYSFFYGIFFFSMLEVNYKILYNGKFIYRIMISFLFVIFPTPCALRLRLMGFAVILYEQLFLLLSEMFWFKTIFIQTSIFLKSPLFSQKSMKTWILRY